MEINELSHPDSIWVYKGSRRGEKVSVWIPYLHEIKKEKAKNTYLVSYRGGEFSMDLSKVDCIMVYGPVGNLPVSFLDALGNNRIPLLIHRRNLANPYYFLPARRADEKDMLTRQVLCRENQVKRAYIARTIIRERIKTLSAFIPPQNGALIKLNGSRSIPQIRSIEAQCAKEYWKSYYVKCGFSGISRRDNERPVNQALNACSVFMAGIFLRWALLHRLAPTHGFLHEPSSYIALIYDLMEPVRWWMEAAVFEAVSQATDEKKYTPYALENLKKMMDVVVYVPVTRQTVRRKSVAHGLVLALRAYLMGDMRRLVLPAEGKQEAGRPMKISYRLPGGMPGDWAKKTAPANRGGIV